VVALQISTKGCDSDNPAITKMAEALTETLMPFANAVVKLADGVEARNK